MVRFDGLRFRAYELVGSRFLEHKLFGSVVLTITSLLPEPRPEKNFAGTSKRAQNKS